MLTVTSESRYEDVLLKFEKKRAIRRGVAVPEHFDEFVKQAEAKKNARRKEKREKAEMALTRKAGKAAKPSKGKAKTSSRRIVAAAPVKSELATDRTSLTSSL